MSDNDGAVLLRRLASALGTIGVTAGAFGAHALKDTLAAKKGAEANWRTAVSYQLFHATALLALSALQASSSDQSIKGKPVAASNDFSTAGKMMAVGTLMFSGSIYCLTLGIGPRKMLGPITPIGGLIMIGGWVATAF